MTRFPLAALTALALTLIAPQAHAAAWMKFGGVEGESSGDVSRDVVIDIVTASARRSIIIIDMATGEADHGSDSDASRDSGRDSGRDATGG